MFTFLIVLDTMARLELFYITPTLLFCTMFAPICEYVLAFCTLLGRCILVWNWDCMALVDVYACKRGKGRECLDYVVYRIRAGCVTDGKDTRYHQKE